MYDEFSKASINLLLFLILVEKQLIFVEVYSFD